MGHYRLNFEADLLPAFLTVAEVRTVSGAAKALNLSQPAVTAQIRKLEDSLGAPLFRRSVNGMALTDAGHRFHDRAKALLAMLDEAAREVRPDSAPSGKLAVLASMTLASHVMPPLLAAFRERYPQVSVVLEVGNSEQVLRRVAKGDVPLGLVEGHARASTLRLEKFMEDEIVPIGRPADAGHVRKVADLLSYPLIWREPGSGTREVVERALRQAGLSRRDFKYAIQLGHPEAIKAGVAAGLGLSFVSRCSIGLELALGQLAVLPLADFKITRHFRWVLPSGALPEPAAEFYRFASRMAS